MTRTAAGAGTTEGFAIGAPEDRWDAARASGKSELELLAYRSNLLGSDRAVANWGGGNTSCKVIEPDHRGRPTAFLWVKGSGSDLASITAERFTALRLDDLRALADREVVSDEELVAYCEHAALRPRQPRASIETALHSFLRPAHVDHTHADAIIALCAIPDGQAFARRLWGNVALWVPYERPGFSLGRRIGLAVNERPEVRVVLLEKHGLVTWGENAESCYHATIEAIGQAALALAERADRRRVFPSAGLLTESDRRALLAKALPALRGALGNERPVILHTDASEPAAAFASRADIDALAALGPACPDHLMFTRAWPLVARIAERSDAPGDAVRAAVTDYRARYASYLTQNGEPAVANETGPRVVIVPGVGIITAGADVQAARLSGALYERARAVLATAVALGGFSPLTQAEAFAIEYWPLERYKLSLAPVRGELAGSVALVTGAASGIGRAVAERLATMGAHVAIADINQAGAHEVAASIGAQHGDGRAIALGMDVADENSIDRGVEDLVLAYGGVDIVVSNAGLATAGPIVDTPLAEWERNQAVLARGSFLIGRAALRVFRDQGRGGSLVLVASKNAVVAGRDAAAYSAAKAAALHFVRCLAEEGGPYGVRANTVNPDAVIGGSGIWKSEWRADRARGYGIEPEELEEFYRQRTTLKVNVTVEDVAEAVLFFASSRSGKTTGAFLNVDGGIPAAYPR